MIQPGRRPRITLSPTLLFRNSENGNQPVMAISVAGGDMQDQAAIQVILNYVDFGMSPEDAFKAPRFATDHFISSSVRTLRAWVASQCPTLSPKQCRPT